jgi:hypothetical protein
MINRNVFFGTREGGKTLGKSIKDRSIITVYMGSSSLHVIRGLVKYNNGCAWKLAECPKRGRFCISGRG